jgi:hypothetical protein
LIYGIVEGWGAIAQTAILHPLLQLRILKLGRIERWRVIHKSGRVEHGSTGVGVEMVEACAIVILGSGIHPGGHDCGKELRQPICSCDKKSAVLFRAEGSIEGLEGRTEMAKRESRPIAMDVATRQLDQ